MLHWLFSDVYILYISVLTSTSGTTDGFSRKPRTLPSGSYIAMMWTSLAQLKNMSGFQIHVTWLKCEYNISGKKPRVPSFLRAETYPSKTDLCGEKRHSCVEYSSMFVWGTLWTTVNTLTLVKDTLYSYRLNSHHLYHKLAEPFGHLNLPWRHKSRLYVELKRTLTFIKFHMNLRTHSTCEGTN